MTFKIEAISGEAFALGEGPHWHPKLRRLFFVDIFGGLVGSIATDAGLGVQHDVLYKAKQGNFVSAVLPLSSDSDNGNDVRPSLVVSIDDAIYSIEPNTGRPSLIDKLHNSAVRFNDAKCDPRGRLWIGTMGLESSPGVLQPEKGSLYMLSAEGKLVEKMDKVSLSNGLTWSHDGRYFYYIDSYKRVIYVFDYELQTGNIMNRRILVNMNEDKDSFGAEELPDGMTIDVLGNLWVAMFRGSRIVNIDAKNGKVIGSIVMPVSLITSVCFGGPNLDEMFVTSSHQFLSEQQKEQQPLAGFIFKVTSSDANFRGKYAHFDLKRNA